MALIRGPLPMLRNVRELAISSKECINVHAFETETAYRRCVQLLCCPDRSAQRSNSIWY